MYPCTAGQCPKKTRRLRSFDTRCRQKMLMTTEAQLPPCVVAFTGPVIKRRIANPAQNAWVSFYMHRVPGMWPSTFPARLQVATSELPPFFVLH